MKQFDFPTFKEILQNYVHNSTFMLFYHIFILLERVLQDIKVKCKTIFKGFSVARHCARPKNEPLKRRKYHVFVDR